MTDSYARPIVIPAAPGTMALVITDVDLELDEGESELEAQRLALDSILLRTQMICAASSSMMMAGILVFKVIPGLLSGLV